MIAFLQGTIRFRESRAMIVDVNGVGYRVYVGSALTQRHEGERVELFTHHHVTSDASELYGFATSDELGLFQSLLKVSGVGPKSALAILSDIPAAEVRQAIINSDPRPLMNVTGIGKKLAERIILELAGTLAERGTVAGDEAQAALERLGYTRREAVEALKHVGQDVADVRDRIRLALRGLNKKP